MSRGDAARLADTTAATIRNWEIGSCLLRSRNRPRLYGALNIQIGGVVVTDQCFLRRLSVLGRTYPTPARQSVWADDLEDHVHRTR